jgi:methyl-accepting chemotaxis protein
MDEGTKQVEEGIQLADKAGVSLKEIVEVSQKVTDMVNQIAAASEEQSSASEQISKNVEAISAVTNQTASGTQQIARAAEDLNQLTENLTQLISKFHLSNEPGGQRPSSMQRSKSIEKSHIAVRSNGAIVEHKG